MLQPEVHGSTLTDIDAKAGSISGFGPTFGWYEPSPLYAQSSQFIAIDPTRQQSERNERQHFSHQTYTPRQAGRQAGIGAYIHVRAHIPYAPIADETFAEVGAVGSLSGESTQAEAYRRRYHATTVGTTQQ